MSLYVFTTDVIAFRFKIQLLFVLFEAEKKILLIYLENICAF